MGNITPSAASYHGGYYSMADVAQVVAYAAERCIEVVPEIELPGHCVAALAAYPELSSAFVTSGRVPSAGVWGTACPALLASSGRLRQPASGLRNQSAGHDGNDAVFDFLQTVLDQVIVQFPYQYIHIGGDEVPKVRWEECDKCQARIQQEGLLNESELQSWFVRRISKYLASRNKKLIGWDEILEGGLAEGATVMSWRGNIGGIIAAKSGHDVIMTPTSHCYFDYRQAPSAAEPGAWYACLPLEVVYHYDPIPQAPGPEALAAAAQLGQASQDEEFEDEELPAAVDAHMSPSASPTFDELAEGSDGQPFLGAADGHTGLLQDGPQMLAAVVKALTPAVLKDWEGFTTRLSAQLPMLGHLGYRAGQAVRGRPWTLVVVIRGLQAAGQFLKVVH
eukprot:gene14504-14629_t